jgi:hypothetical protein
MNEPTPDETSLPHKAKLLLERYAQQLEPATVARLHLARQQALEAAQTARQSYWHWVPAGALALGLAGTLTFLVILEQPAVQPPPQGQDWEIIAAGEDWELLEDWEFYEWLGSLEQSRLNNQDGQAS